MISCHSGKISYLFLHWFIGELLINVEGAHSQTVSIMFTDVNMFSFFFIWLTCLDMDFILIQGVNGVLDLIPSKFSGNFSGYHLNSPSQSVHFRFLYILHGLKSYTSVSISVL